MKTRMNECNFLNSFGSCLCMLILAGVLASCNFGNKPDFNKTDTQQNEKKYVEITGKLKLSVGALPSKVFVDANNSSSNENNRSALPSFSGTRSYYILATTGSGNEAQEISGQVDEATQTYTITLDSEKIWNIEAGFKLDGETVLSDIWEDVDPSTDKTHNFILKPSINPTKFGEISLELTIKNELKDTISRVSADCISSNKENWEVKLTPSDIVFEETEDVKVTISTSSIPSGLYEVSIEFYNESNVRVYSTIQAINVFDSLTTNTWLSNGGISPIKSDGTFELTSDLIKIYEKTHFYVGETAFCDAPDDTSATGSPVKPFASIAGAANYLSTYGNKAIDYTLYVNGTLEEAQTLDGDILAQSITITGYNGLDYITHEPQDSITVTDDSSALTISTEIPVTIRDLKISKGSGHGLHVASDAKVFLAGNPVIDDLYLESTSTYYEEYYSPGSLLLAEDLGSFASITITPDTYTAPYYDDSEGGYIIKVQYVSIEEESTIDIAENSKYFSITPELDGDENPTDTEWIIDDNGCLNKYCILTFEGEGINSMTTQKVPCTYFEPGKLIEPTREGYLFKGYYYQKETEHWGGSQYYPEQQPSTYEMLSFDYKEADYEDEEGNTVTDSNYTFVNSDMTLYATWRCLTINNIYVDADNGADSVWCSQDGSTISLGDGSEGFPLRTLNSAFDLIKEINDATEDYTITISGFTNEHDLPINSELPVNSLTLQGRSSAETDGIKASNISVSVLPVSTTKSFTIRNMLINLSNVSYAVEGAVMNIGNGSTVTLEEGTIFEGPSSSVDSKGAVAIENGGTLIMQNDVTFQKFDIKCGAVNVKTGGTFTMNGGTFTNNESNGTCGAVYVNGGTFTMKDGYIKDNWQDAFQRADALPQGAGVCVASGTFIMEGGHITGNKSCVADGHDNMTTAGGGVFVYADGEFIMRGGEISDNHAYNQKISVAGSIYEEIDTTAHSYGGGVCLQASENKLASFTMTGGTISGNTAGTSGNGIGFIGTPNEGVTGTITLGKDALITPDNDVYLPSFVTITVGHEFTGDDANLIKATITPQEYQENQPILKAAENVNLETEYDYFAVTPQGTTTWTINEEGKLVNGGSGSSSNDGFTAITGAIIEHKAGSNENEGDYPYVNIPSLYVANSLVTQSEYEKYMTYFGSNTPTEGEDDKDSSPVYNVSWIDAIIYCNLRSMAENKQPVYALGGKTDPASDTWEVKNVTKVTNNGKDFYYYNSNVDNDSFDNGNDFFTFNLDADGYRLMTGDECEYIHENYSELFSGSTMNEWTQTFNSEPAAYRLFYSHVEETCVGKFKGNATREEDLGFRVVRNADTNSGSNP